LNLKRTLSYLVNQASPYPNLKCRDRTSARGPVSRDAWIAASGLPNRDAPWAYMLWYFTLLPRAPGTGPDEQQNNRWKYVYDFTRYDKTGKPINAYRSR
jgi:hypothetical protein